ncbi:MAG: SDR family NAD(P)-dependent oxidoreductase [Bacteroidetes bacterium]|nr:SDR family NAD(P)-dependent oxidoreductase [Bacteroidota bacterium]
MKSAIVVGATSGMGQSLAMKLAQEGYRVGIVGRRTERLNEMVRSNPEAFIPLTLDISREDAIRSLNTLVRDLGGLDLLVMAAAYGFPYNALDHDVTVDIISTNVRGFTMVVDWGLKLFLEQGSGQLVSFSSIAGMRGSGVDPAYCAAKAFQMNYLEGVRQVVDQHQKSIYITEIRPGFVEKNDSHVETRFWIDPLDKATQRIYQGIHENRKVVYLSKRWAFIAFLLSLVPKLWLEKLMQGYMQPDHAKPTMEPSPVRPPGK